MPPPGALAPEQTRRFLVMMWVALLVSVGLYYYITVTLPAGPPDPGSPLVYPLLGLAIASAAASRYFKSRFGVREGWPRSLAMVRAAYIVAMVFCEVPALLGLVVFFVSAWPRSWIFFVISLAGLILNFPNRADFESFPPAKLV